MFEIAEAYERQRGRSSKILAPLFVDFVGVQGEILDVGCGTGALTFAIAKSKSVSKIVAIDVSEAFLAYARFKTDDPRISFESGDAQHLRFSDASFDQCLALLVMRFIPDAPQDKDQPGSYGTAEELSSLWASAGLENIEAKNIGFECGFDSFEDLWQPLTEGQGPAGAYLRGISDDHRMAVRNRLRQNLIGDRTDGRFMLKAKAWAVRGTVPE